MTTFLHDLCSIPTAPFVEDRVVQWVESFARSRRKLRLSRDEFGNLLLELPGKKKSLPRWVFTAHMDHPGLVTRGMIDETTVEADFRGYVLADYVQGTRVRFFDAGREILGTVTQVEPDEDPTGRGACAKVVRVRVKEPVASNVAGMFDLGEGRVKGKRFHSRVCDDLAGAAAAFAMLDELHRNPPASPVAVLLTRAEEEGFVGAIAASLKPKLLRKSDRLIAIECSAEQPYAPQGQGVIIRVGDRTSIFNSALTYHLTQTAEELKKKDESKSFAFQRALMPGGTCEATVYDLYGYHAAAVCVALGNYHNMDKGKKKLAAEYVHLADWDAMVRLFVELARTGHGYTGKHAALRERIEKRFNGLKHLL